MDKLILKVSEEFTKSPGPRYVIEGDFSGQVFYNTLLKTKYIEAVEKDCKLIINLDGTYGYGTSFLEEAFGGLVRDGFENVWDRIEIVTLEEDYLEDDIKKYIQEAEVVRRDGEK